MKNYSGVICKNDKVFMKFAEMLKNAKTNQIAFSPAVAFRLSLKDILTKGRLVGLKYDDEAERAISAKVRVPFGNKEVDYTLNVENGVVNASGGTIV